ncbi:TetR/AcrR family transcriptional regulator [Halobacterium jilantaiense]|uniref:Transcriptional regulator, TetR family n=1 Tax=Halobacterium jilantaiense TaxID=355548 RepID=A0A1I0NA30_9EURY|nr:TetR/AcrR family transcriptional regulator [Halobacterium jilantaiense]SEV97889.1 transcriptional regulator, TetR family [Halobacterium jilantaiense]
MHDDPATDLLDATYRALCRHGYADLTLRDVAAEANRSKASIHYHYDDRETLFAALLDHLYDEYTDRLDAADGQTPIEHIRALFDASAAGDRDGRDRAFCLAMLEVSAQAPYDADVRAQLHRFEDALTAHVRDAVADGVDTGAFADSVDPDAAADALVTAAVGVHARSTATDCSRDRLTAATVEYVEAHLTADDATEAVH